MFMQYNRRESFEIVGIPSTVSTDDLEEEVIDISSLENITMLCPFLAIFIFLQKMIQL